MVGHDWGGLLVWPFARRFPERTAGVVGVNTPDIRTDRCRWSRCSAWRLPDQPPYIVQFQDYGPAEYFLGATEPPSDPGCGSCTRAPPIARR